MALSQNTGDPAGSNGGNPIGEKNMRSILSRLLKNESGATAIEYGLIASLIAVGTVAVLGTVGSNLSATFSTVASAL